MSWNNVINKLDRNYLSVLLKKLKMIQLQQELFSNTTEQMSIKELKILAESANILATSLSSNDKKKALEIAVSIPKISDNKGLSLSSFLTLRKLGNYPAIKLLEKEKELEEYKDLLTGISAFEEYIFESFNEKNFINKNFLLTNFQNKVFDTLNNNDGVSISAPTSAGKSFVLLKYILDFIYQRRQIGATVIYIVPTRALIKQVMNDFAKNIEDLGIKDIYIGCSSEIENVISLSTKSNILVLTQERLYQLCTKPDVKLLNISMVVADEAHNIQSGGRGVLLEGAIKYVKALFPEAKILFSSPLVSNPEKLLSTFNIEHGKKEKDTFPLVNQNIITVKKVSKQLIVNALYEEDEITINTLPYEDKSNSKASILANVTNKLWNHQTSIVYSSEPMLSANVARNLYESGNFPVLNNERLQEFADFIEDYISSNFELANFIRCGIAFHFGSLPAIIRSGIEELFKEGLIKIVSCTSTLLEGLNMPAKNIFIYKPEKGKVTIDKLSFWNLAGRAGRMGNDFSGNIICINVEEWKENPLVGEKSFPIRPSAEIRLREESQQFKEYISNRNMSSGTDDYNEQLVSMVVRDRIAGKRIQDSHYINNENRDNLKEIDRVTESIIKEFKPPLSLLNNIPGVMPDRVNELWEFLEQKEELYESLMPIFPVYMYDKGYNRFKLIIRIINRFFMKDKEWSEEYIKKLAIVGYKWMLGSPLSQIIFYKNNSNHYKDKQLTSYVKKEIEFLNDKIRYQLVKYTQIYTEVLKAFLETKGKGDELTKIVKLSSYLEFGACSTPALEFMALGLPREAAILLSEEFNNQNITNEDSYLKWLKNIDINNLAVAEYLKKQIAHAQNIL